MIKTNMASSSQALALLGKPRGNEACTETDMLRNDGIGAGSRTGAKNVPRPEANPPFHSTSRSL
jgi:hypothetical protein